MYDVSLKKLTSPEKQAAELLNLEMWHFTVTGCIRQELSLTLQPQHVDFKDGDAKKFKREQLPLKTPDFWTYKPKYRFSAM